MSSWAVGRARAPHRRAERLGPLALYGLLAFLFLGLRVVLEPGSAFLGYGTDPRTFIWCFGWWPYAILHGQNPFVAHALWAPSGVNLVWTASVPGLALLCSPLTLLFGPVAAYNVAATAFPALAAWTAYLLCRYVTGAFWPSLVGGYLFGFSSALLAQDEGHPHIAAAFLLPLVALLCLRFLDGALDGRGLVLRLGPALALELLVSTEVSFTLALALLAALVLGYLLVPARRARLRALLVPLLGAALLGTLLTAPFVYYAIRGFEAQAFHPPSLYEADLVNYVVPTKVALASLGWAGSLASRFAGNNAERDAYLGLPVLLIVALYARRRAGSPGGRFLLAALALAVLASLGERLTFAGWRLIRLPWWLVGRLPLFDNVLTARLAFYVDLLAALAVALWAASAGGRWRIVLPALAVLAVLPNPLSGLWATRFSVPAFFTDAAYRTCLRPGEIVLALPISSESVSMLWQAVDGYRFRLAGGDIAPRPPAAFTSPRAIAEVAEGHRLHAAQSSALALFLAREGVASVVVDAHDAGGYAGALDRLATPEQRGGIVYYAIGSSTPRCSAATRGDGSFH